MGERVNFPDRGDGNNDDTAAKKLYGNDCLFD